MRREKLKSNSISSLVSITYKRRRLNFFLFAFLTLIAFLSWKNNYPLRLIRDSFSLHLRIRPPLRSHYTMFLLFFPLNFPSSSSSCSEWCVKISFLVFLSTEWVEFASLSFLFVSMLEYISIFLSFSFHVKMWNEYNGNHDIGMSRLRVEKLNNSYLGDIQYKKWNLNE